MSTWSPNSEDGMAAPRYLSRKPSSTSETRFSSDSRGMSRLMVAVSRLRSIFAWSNGSVVPSLFAMMSGISSRRSYVVKRAPHARHSRLRRMLAPSSEDLESTTFDSVVPQLGHSNELTSVMRIPISTNAEISLAE